jgi:hypothetical protein
MALIQRVQDILLKPKETWPAIAQEPASVASIYNNYVIYLAAIPAIAGFIGLSLVGVGGFGGFGFRIPIVSGLVNMVVGYVLSLAMVFVLALVVDALAPTFSGTKDRVAALKVVAYGSTAGFVGGVFSLLPALSILGLIAALYSIYLIYTALPTLMRCPPEKAGAYTAVVIVCGIVLGVLIGIVSSAVLPSRMMGAGALGGRHGDVSIKTPDGEVKIDTSKMEEMARKAEEAAKRMEQAQKSGDSAAAGKAMGEMMGAVTGMAGGAGVPIPAQDLKALLPESIGDLPRKSFEAQGGQAMGIAGSSAKGSYEAGDRRIRLSITDTGGLAGLAALAGWANMTVDRETDGQVEKVYKQGNRTIREAYHKDGSHGEVTVILANGVIVEADGDRVDAATLKKVVEGVDLGKVEAMQRPAK